MVKALAGTSWGQDKETLLLTYKVLVKTKLDYAAPVWSPNAKPSSLKRLQTIQNSGLRVVTGSHKLASEDHLHAETKVLPVPDHLAMLNSQYLASSLRADHPANEPVSRPPGRRDKKFTLQSKYLADVEPRLVNGVLPAGAFPETKVAIHSKYVEAAITKQGNHPLLNTPAPPIDDSEQTLPRHYRSTLSQLQSGHCVNLNNYLRRVGRSATASCPYCDSDDQSVPHLFNCRSHGTNLSISDLWNKPTQVATFLSTHPSFALPPLSLPRPRPPPEPPP